MPDITANNKDRLKASEYIAKTNDAFIDKKEVLGNFDNKIELGFVDPAEGNG